MAQCNSYLGIYQNSISSDYYYFSLVVIRDPFSHGFMIRYSAWAGFL